MADSGDARRRAGRRGLWIVAGIAGLAAVAAVLGIWHLPDRMYPGTSDGAVQARAALQGGLLTAAAALTAVAGGLIALDETRQANTETRRANVAADAREREANANTHVRELYIAAIGLLSAETVDGRLGGIYALERVARDSADDQRTVVEVLSAFVREHARPPAAGAPPMVRPTTDVQAALTVLGRLPAREGLLRADLTGANLTGARLSGANLTGAQMHGANLTNAVLVQANFTNAVLIQANFTDALLGMANLTNARLDETIFIHAVLGMANLTGAVLETADLTGAWLDQANLTDADMHEANLAGAERLVQEQVDGARGNGQTRLPAGLVRPASWTSGDASGS